MYKIYSILDELNINELKHLSRFRNIQLTSRCEEQICIISYDTIIIMKVLSKFFYLSFFYELLPSFFSSLLKLLCAFEIITSHDCFKESVLHKIRWERGLETVYRRLVFISISRRDLESKFCIHFEINVKYTGVPTS